MQIAVSSWNALMAVRWGYLDLLDPATLVDHTDTAMARTSHCSWAALPEVPQHFHLLLPHLTLLAQLLQRCASFSHNLSEKTDT